MAATASPAVRDMGALDIRRQALASPIASELSHPGEGPPQPARGAGSAGLGRHAGRIPAGELAWLKAPLAERRPIGTPTWARLARSRSRPWRSSVRRSRPPELVCPRWVPLEFGTHVRHRRLFLMT